MYLKKSVEVANKILLLTEKIHHLSFPFLGKSTAHSKLHLNISLSNFIVVLPPL